MSHPLLTYLEAAHPDLTLDARLKLFALQVPRPPRAPMKGRRKRVAERLTTTGGYLYQIVRGYRHPSRSLARRIEEVTGGKVSAAVLLVWSPPTGEPALRAAS